MTRTSKPQQELSPVKRAIVELREMRQRVDELEREKHEPIAIVGIGCRYPGGVKSPDDFWNLLANGVDAISEIPADRWDIERLYDPEGKSPGKMSTKFGGFLDDVDQFDADFFGVSPREAASLDPQQRLLLEVSWEALEHAGLANDKLKGGKTGVYFGVGGFDYSQLEATQGSIEEIDAYFATGAAHSCASGRISYFLGLQGPSLSVDTACSSSLVATHLAAKALRSKECNMALAGGISMILAPTINIGLSKANMMAPDGRCKTFDESADGFVRSEGCGVIVLKRLSDALADNDSILAVIRGSAINQDGRSNGLTAPNGPSQRRVIRDALVDAEVDPENISYVETHGTGTDLGDPIEIQALGSVMRTEKGAHRLAVGSVKTNIGHAEGAAGVAGLIKVVLAMQNQTIPPHLHLKSRNPKINWNEHSFDIPTENTAWEPINGKRLAGVSSFGFSGTNAHVILEEHADARSAAPNSHPGRGKGWVKQSSEHSKTSEDIPLPPFEGGMTRASKTHSDSPLRRGAGGDVNHAAVLTLSAKRPEALRDLAQKHAEHLEDNPNLELNDICGTTSTGRFNFDHRLAVVAKSTQDFQKQLTAYAENAEHRAITGSVTSLHQPNIVFLFTGQGSQYFGMAKSLYESEPVFKNALDRCDENLREHLGDSILDVIFDKNALENVIDSRLRENDIVEGDGNSRSHALRGNAAQDASRPVTTADSAEQGSISEGGARDLPTPNPSQDGNSSDASRPAIDQTRFTQPSLFAVEYALAELWQSWGIKPAAVMGHSVGEYVAATVAGAMTLEDGLKLITMRGKLMQEKTEPGTMIAVFAELGEVEKLVENHQDSLAIAAVNGPQNIVVSGKTDAIQEIVKICDEREIKHKKLAVSRAFHSPTMDPILDDFEKAAASVTQNPLKTPMVSNLTGETLQPGETLDAKYWSEHIRQPVQFVKSMQALWNDGQRVFLEIGANPVLLGMAQRFAEGDAAKSVWLPSLRKGREDMEQMLETLGQLYVRGVKIDWQNFYADKPFRKVHLPTYAWQKQRYWFAKKNDGFASAEPEKAPNWRDLVTAGEHQAEHIPLNLHIHTYAEKWAGLDKLTKAYIAKTLHELGAFTQAGDKYTIPEFLQKFHVADTYRHLMARWFDKLIEENWLEKDGDAYRAPNSLPQPDLEAMLVETRKLLAEIPELFEYIERCGGLLAKVITEKESALETLFPGGTYKTADFLYHRWGLPLYFNGIARALAEAAVRTMPSAQKIKILEIGAGTGGTSAQVFPILPPERTEYHYTDLSEFFHSDAQARFKNFPFIKYGIYNAEQSGAEQGYGAHDFDIVIAANVIHATRNLYETLQNVHDLLKPGGVFILYETISQPSWFEITISLIEGWQIFEDDLRDDHPLMPAEKWENVLRKTGFENVATFPKSDLPTEILAQNVLIAQTPLADKGAAKQAIAATAGTMENGAVNGEATQAPELENAAESLLATLNDLPETERFGALIDYTRKHVLKVLRRDPNANLGRHERLMDIGVDSLMAVELRNNLAAGAGLDENLPATLIFDYSNIESIAKLLEDELFGEKETVAESAQTPVEENAQGTDVSGMSDDDVEAMLIQKLDDLG